MLDIIFNILVTLKQKKIPLYLPQVNTPNDERAFFKNFIKSSLKGY